MVNELRSVNRTETPWVVVGLHRPLYTTDIWGYDWSSNQGVAADLRAAFEELFFLYEVC